MYVMAEETLPASLALITLLMLPLRWLFGGDDGGFMTLRAVHQRRRHLTEMAEWCNFTLAVGGDMHRSESDPCTTESYFMLSMLFLALDTLRRLQCTALFRFKCEGRSNKLPCTSLFGHRGLGHTMLGTVASVPETSFSSFMARSCANVPDLGVNHD